MFWQFFSILSSFALHSTDFNFIVKIVARTVEEKLRSLGLGQRNHECIFYFKTIFYFSHESTTSRVKTGSCTCTTCKLVLNFGLFMLFNVMSCICFYISSYVFSTRMRFNNLNKNTTRFWPENILNNHLKITGLLESFNIKSQCFFWNMANL